MINPALQSYNFSATDALRDAVLTLQRARIENASLDARLLLQHVLGVSREELLASGKHVMTAAQQADYRNLIEKRTSRQPVSQLVGRREFYSLTFRVTPDVLDPRPDSETLVEAVLEWVMGHGSMVKGSNSISMTNDDRSMTILDLGTGTGCLLLSLLAALPNARGIGADSSEAALEVARGNAQALKLGQRVRFIRSHWDDNVEGKFDIIISNPPYIPTHAIASLAPEVAQFEPRCALDGGEDGLDAYRAILPRLPARMKKNALAVLEIGVGQNAEIEELITGSGLRVAGAKRDLGGMTRCLLIN